ncbi:bifunctional diguanylate cyclase/phosphodiesterase [Aurantimonas sp. MSK8Z-1]|uniref:putative bifunctional diguanylate cyclase/phosphodiesterase n=1 Tax=Mangrovibrevibacter kandeliae TaxID=2968473 RepID=UPI0021185FCB|nr:bifunctional diguanylate cyclase/phosphodiesterase [Aurantimonas sp. MSK8Z-1]MCW4114093.1 bifunctional diguanylate cyclase/phosphodiesterase [Aurantimonas sp. MSK8Z-1]
MLRKLKRYGGTILGGVLLASVVALAVITLASFTVGSLVETAMREKGRQLTDLLIANPDTLDALLTGIARDSDAETTIRKVAGLADIRSFAVFDRTGNEVFRSRSERYKWLLRDRPGGISSGDKLSTAIMQQPGFWQVVYDDGRSNPSVLTPLIRGGTVVGYVSVVADMIDDRAAYVRTLTSASGLLLAIILFATGTPALLFFLRQRNVAEANDRIYFLANHDPLTQLLNRTRMQEEMDKILAQVRATREALAYFFIDIDGLAAVNDTLGQACGDELLRVVASRMASVVDKADLLARIAADDFVLVHRRLGGREEIAEIARRITEAVSEPVKIGDQVIRPRVSIGVATLPEDGRTRDELIKHAELALLYHKQEKVGEYVLFQPFMDEETHRRREIEAKVREAVEADGFSLFYQPIVNGDGSRLLGFEALLRLQVPTGEFISPAEFIPIAEARGYIKAIGTWAIREAARQIAAWPDPLFVSVNLSAVQFRDGDLVGIVREALDAAGVSGRRLEIEVVESLLLDRSDEILGQLNELKALGVSIDMDDFGTGYSSLGYLWRFPFDKLKIDQSFMFAFENGEPNVSEIIATIVSLAHHMHMKVTAEGVETQQQLDLLRSVGCDQIQGYLFGKPMPADKVASEVLNRFRSRTGASDNERSTRQRSAAPASARDALALG